MPVHIALDGFMGAGKSSVGKRLARVLARPFIDLDGAVEASYGAIPAIFESGGEPFFRRLEHEALLHVLRRPPAVIALGGGTITFEANAEPLRRLCYRVFIDAPPATLLRRLQRAKRLRPLLGKPVRPERILKLYEARLQLYRSADLCISANAERPETIAHMILRALPPAAA